MSEYDECVLLANHVLETRRDPDCDEAMLSRQFLRAVEKIERLQATIATKDAEIERLRDDFARAIQGSPDLNSYLGQYLREPENAAGFLREQRKLTKEAERLEE